MLDVPEPDTRLEQRPLERERAPEQERDQIVTPVRRRVGHLVGEHAVLVDPVAGNVRPEIRARRHADRLGRPHVGHLEQRARPRIALAEQEKVVRLLLRQHRQVGLDVVLAEARGDPGELATVEASIRRQYISPEGRDDLLEGGLSGLHDVTGQLVGIDHIGP